MLKARLAPTGARGIDGGTGRHAPSTGRHLHRAAGTDTTERITALFAAGEIPAFVRNALKKGMRFL